MEYPQGKPITLTGHVKALFFAYRCGASCGDSVIVWEKEGIPYTVSLKAGSLHDTLAMADSVAPIPQ
jgi:hypothetical protein